MPFFKKKKKTHKKRKREREERIDERSICVLEGYGIASSFSKET